jgi:hypothetical protein
MIFDVLGYVLMALGGLEILLAISEKLTGLEEAAAAIGPGSRISPASWRASSPTAVSSGLPS